MCLWNLRVLCTYLYLQITEIGSQDVGSTIKSMHFMPNKFYVIWGNFSLTFFVKIILRHSNLYKLAYFLPWIWQGQWCGSYGFRKTHVLPTKNLCSLVNYSQTYSCGLEIMPLQSFDQHLICIMPADKSYQKQPWFIVKITVHNNSLLHKSTFLQYILSSRQCRCFNKTFKNLWVKL